MGSALSASLAFTHYLLVLILSSVQQSKHSLDCQISSVAQNCFWLRITGLYYVTRRNSSTISVAWYSKCLFLDHINSTGQLSRAIKLWVVIQYSERLWSHGTSFNIFPRSLWQVKEECRIEFKLLIIWAQKLTYSISVDISLIRAIHMPMCNFKRVRGKSFLWED